ncbi:uncharacterized protein LY79DRAFT_244346 [Colletotrichum navitas]|uniref:Uncharacterized protein n=1 Tax=Colletotrichum navitas TaxID=681940 RepID=A0AAD8PWJ9_9PEZI|nr:uncharacterized protein LY79DRAFT_244346 [Colletotrichum navitas]KAK1586010.1 hypothetical protein LY79DRAFT_244346 [Colletotrichum navitas]
MIKYLRNKTMFVSYAYPLTQSVDRGRLRLCGYIASINCDFARIHLTLNLSHMSFESSKPNETQWPHINSMEYFRVPPRWLFVKITDENAVMPGVRLSWRTILR